MMKKCVYFFLLILGCVITNANADTIANHSSLQWMTTNAISHHTATSYVQTPIGGGPGSSDYQRPTLQELGLSHIPFADQTICWQSGLWKFLVGYQQIQSFAFTQLSRALLTYGVKLFTNTPLKSYVQFDWYRFGIHYEMPFLFHTLLAPQLDISLLDFAYQFQTHRWTRGRHYHHLTPRAGFTLTVPLQNNVVLIVSAMTSLIPLDALTISSASLAIQFNTAPNDKLLLGSQLVKINFEDGQALPNHIHLNSGAMLIAGESKNF